MLFCIHLRFIVCSMHVKAVSAIVREDGFRQNCRCWTANSTPGPVLDGWEFIMCSQVLHWCNTQSVMITYKPRPIPVPPWLFLTNPMSVLYLDYLVIFMHQFPVLSLNYGPTMYRVLSLQLDYFL